MKHYATRDPMALGEHYTAHVMAMTAEALHSKSDIAAELAWRDAELARLREALGPAVDATYATFYCEHWEWDATVSVWLRKRQLEGRPRVEIQLVQGFCCLAASSHRDRFGAGLNAAEAHEFALLVARHESTGKLAPDNAPEPKDAA